MGKEDEESDPNDFRALWLSVIAQALVDAKSRSGKRCAKQARAEAIAWFGQTGEGSDFARVCDLAGVQTTEIRDVFRKVMRGEKSVDFRCLRKPKEGIEAISRRDQFETNNINQKEKRHER